MGRFRGIAILSALFIFLCKIAAAQQYSTSTSAHPPPALSAYWNQPASDTPPIRDLQALAVIQASIAAMGGRSAISQVQSVVVNIQGTSPSSSAGGPIVLEVSGSQFRSDAQGPSGTVTFSSGNGTPYRSISGKASSVPLHVARASFWPALVASSLVVEFQNSAYSLQYKGASTLGSEPVIVVATVLQDTRLDAAITPQTWYFDSTSNLPVRVEYRLPSAHRPDQFQTGAADLSNYQAVGGILYPCQQSLSIGKSQIGTRTVTSVQPNSVISSSEFDLPGGGLQ